MVVARMADIKRVRSSTVYDSRTESPFYSVVYSSVTEYISDLLDLSKGESSPRYQSALANIERHENCGGTTINFQLSLGEKKANH